jgi:hypothetical protein
LGTAKRRPGGPDALASPGLDKRGRHAAPATGDRHDRGGGRTAAAWRQALSSRRSPDRRVHKTCRPK